MDTLVTEATVSVMETEKIDEIENEEKIDEIEDDVANDHELETNQQQQRQDFTSDTFKIEVTNMGKFAFGVCRINLQFQNY